MGSQDIDIDSTQTVALTVQLKKINIAADPNILLI
jgi:hypothetical protein